MNYVCACRLREFGLRFSDIPSKDELLSALRMRSQFEEARAKGLGAVRTPEGGMLDEAILPIIQGILDAATFYGVDISALECELK